jgi:hypothetical protein
MPAARGMASCCMRRAYLTSGLFHHPYHTNMTKDISSSSQHHHCAGFVSDKRGAVKNLKRDLAVLGGDSGVAEGGVHFQKNE